ncbi:MAG TPA: cyclopropane-fatty-acyl-phospholipid synthase family protein [Marinobacterium sp.]|nr:cyclopropane-fatty-acyl-phospholipid synthase family protein [Marinobacterium sp.]
MKPSEYSTTTPSQIATAEEGWLSRRYLQQVLSRLPELEYGTLSLFLPSGKELQFGQANPGEPRAEVRLKSLKPISRLLRGGLIGWAESYMDGEWDSPDIVALVRWALGNEHAMDEVMKGHPVLNFFNRLVHLARSNTRKGSRKNIAYHYDLGNEFYQLWLDPSMTYSSALYEQTDDLQEAQLTKYRRICQMLDVKPGERVLEIGCGWGGFAEVAAAEFGAVVTGITLSKEQLKYAQKRIADAGLSDKAEFQLIDYRDVSGQFDHIVSIEMFEAVGQEHWPTYFKQVRELLKPGSSALLQVITIENERFDAYARAADFIQKYIFPGGMLPSPEKLEHQVSQAHLTLDEQFFFGQDYARTLAEWRHSFLAQWPRIQAQGFDERFRRMWLYYLTYCEGGFTEGSIDVGLFKISR